MSDDSSDGKLLRHKNRHQEMWMEQCVNWEENGEQFNEKSVRPDENMEASKKWLERKVRNLEIIFSTAPNPNPKVSKAIQSFSVDLWTG